MTSPVRLTARRVTVLTEILVSSLTKMNIFSLVQPIFSYYATTAGARRPQVVLLLLVSPSYYSRSFFAVLATLYHASPLKGGW